ncbi:MAG TPA: hypothetical protein VL326_31655 [Kofleriaceae bacterium]|nr:hypothetical protein [Kofleriaceae bacterium]
MWRAILVVLVVADVADADTPSYRVYATKAANVETTTVEWDDGEATFDKTSAHVVSTFVRSDKTRAHDRAYYASRPDGVYLVGRLGDSESETLTESGSIAEPAQLVLPIPFAAGNYPLKSRSKLVSSGNYLGHVDVQGELEVGGAQTVTVPAGSIDCVIVKTTATMHLVFVDPTLAKMKTYTKTTSTACYSPTIGLVRDEVETVTSTASDAKKKPNVTRSTVTTELTAFKGAPAWLVATAGVK